MAAPRPPLVALVLVLGLFSGDGCSALPQLAVAGGRFVYKESGAAFEPRGVCVCARARVCVCEGRRRKGREKQR